MTRQELYHKVKTLGAADAIKAKFGDNFTRVSNANLEDFLKGFKKKAAPAKKVVKASTMSLKTKTATNAVIKLISILQTKKILSAEEAEEVVKAL